MAHKLYYAPGSGNSFKPALVLRQTGQTCTFQKVDVLTGESRNAEFLKINSRGQVPYLITSDGRGIGESNAIAWYLAQGTSLVPDDPVTRAQILQWMIFEQTSLEPNISPARFFTHIVPSLRDQHAAELPGWLEAGSRGLGILDEYLYPREFMVGDGYTVADIAVYGYTHLAEQGGFELARYPAVGRWMQRVQSTPGYANLDALLPS